MAKTIITNLDSLIDVKVTENVNVIAANAASATATAKAGEAATSADVAELHKIAAADSVMAAGTNADNAATSADIASVNAGVSTTQAGIATVQAGLAVTAKNNTDALYAAALDVLAQTNKMYDDFDDRWLGGHSSNPITDNDGNDVLDGALYWNTTVKAIRVYSQTSEAWANIKDANGSLLIVNNLADVNDNAEARTNLDVYSKSETSAAIGTKVGTVVNSLKGVANGIAELDVNGLVPSSQLPSYVDDVIEVATYADLPVTGESGKIYVVIADETSNGDTSSYRWTGTVYAMVSNTLTAADVKALYESNLDTNAYTDAEKTKVGHITVTQAVDLDTIESDTSLNSTHRTSNGTDHTYINQDVTTTATPTFAGIITTGLVDGRDVSVDGLKLDGIEAGATADQTKSEIDALGIDAATVSGLTVKTAVPVGALFTDTTYTDAEIKTKYENNLDTNAFTDAEKTKLASQSGINTGDQDLSGYSLTSHNHSGVYEPADATILKDADIGSTVQAYNVNTVIDANYIAYTQTEKAKVANIPDNTDLILGTTTLTRFDKILGSMNIIAMDYLNGDLVTVRYTGDNDTSVFYRDVLEYTAGDLTTVKHYYNTANLVTESGLTTLVYDIDKNLISSSYTEV